MIDENEELHKIINYTAKKSKKKFDNKVFKFLRIFPREELIAVRRFIISPYYNTNPIVTELFQYVRRYHEDGYVSHRLVNEVVFEYLFPDETYSHRKLINLYSDLAVLLEKYLAVKELESNQMTRHKVLIDAYGKRRKFDFFEKEIDKGLKLVDQLKRHNDQYYKDRILLNSVMYEYPATDQFKKDRKRLPNLLDNLNQYYCLNKLRYTAYYLNDAKLFTTLEQREKILGELDAMGELVSSATAKNPLIDFYARLVDLQRNEFHIERFLKMREIFTRRIHLFELEEKRAAYIALLNLIARVYNRNGDYLGELFETQVLGLEQKLFINDEYLSDVSFINIVGIGCLSNEFSRVLELTKIHEKYLNPKISKDIVNLANATVEYHQQRYEQSLRLIAKIERSTVNIDLRSRILAIRNHTEMLQQSDIDGSIYEQLSYNAGLCIKFLQRDKDMNNTLKNRNILFLKIVRKIAITARNKHLVLNKTQLANEARRIEGIRKRIEQNNVAYKQWLLAQLELVES